MPKPTDSDNCTICTPPFYCSPEHAPPGASRARLVEQSRCIRCGAPVAKTVSEYIAHHRDRLTGIVANNQLPENRETALWFLAGQIRSTGDDVLAMLRGFCGRHCAENAARDESWSD